MNSKPIQSAFLATLAATALIAGAVSPAMARANDPTTDAKAKQDDQADKASQKKYCVQISATSTGTVMPKRECHTRADWISKYGVDPTKKN